MTAFSASDVAAFETALGDPRDPESAIPFADSLELDETASFPQHAVDAVDAFGLAAGYVPEKFGGRMGAVLPPLLMIRSIARRDVTVAVAHGKTFLGAVSTWVGGNAHNRDRMADIVLAGDAVSWGLTERGRGSDLGASHTRITTAGGGMTLDGDKWPINNATRGRAMTVLARLDDQVGPRALSLVHVDKRQLASGTATPLEKVPTHGIRGADISGLSFSGAEVTPDDMIGAPGQGLEIVLKSLQLTRPLCTALSLGAADLGLATAGGFVLERRMFGRDLSALPEAQHVLVAAAADALTAEITSAVGARHVHERIDEMAVISALVKYVVPETVDLLLRDLSQLLGARSQLVEFGPGAVFQKVQRDHRVVGIFDGNTVVNLSVIVGEFTSMLRDAEPIPDDEILALGRITDPNSSLDVDRLRLFSRRGSALLRALVSLSDRGAALVPASGFAADCAALAAEYERTIAEIATFARLPFPPPEQHLAAERLALLFAAACAFAVAAGEPGASRAFGSDFLWLRMIVARLCDRLGIRAASAAERDALDSEAFEVVSELLASGRAVSVIEPLMTAGVPR